LRRLALPQKKKNGVREPVQQRGKEKKARIITAARKLMNTSDYEAVTTNRIAGEAGVSVGTFYAYFKDKRDVFLEVISQYSEDVFGEMIDNIQEMKQRPVSLEEVVRRLILVAKKRHDHEKGLHKQMLVQSIRDPEIQKLALMEEGRADSLIREIFDQYTDQIDVKDVDAAIFLVSTCVEEIIHHLILYGSDIPEERVFEELVRMVYRYLVRP
jgi:AcrR family transcriptional regulator